MGLCSGSLARGQLETSSINSPTFESTATNITGSENKSINASPNRHVETNYHLKVFSLRDLKAATKNFKPDLLLGEGTFGKVYKGWLDEKTFSPTDNVGNRIKVAVKTLRSENLQEYFQEWQSKVKFLETLSHPNIVKLLGYCLEDRVILLVYEFVPKGNLENHLFRRIPSNELLYWNTRVKIAIDVAEGLAYLHASENQIILKNFDTSNILLDESYSAKICDFGLAKFGHIGEESHLNNAAIHVSSHAAPEYIHSGRLNVKSNVYGYGVVLLEMLSGLRAHDLKRPDRQRNLVKWAKPCLSHKRKLKTIIDFRIEGQYSLDAAFQIAQLILQCLEDYPTLRPSMNHVVEALHGVEAIS
ncbi:probable serine/threonine-protein kinase PIX13 [Prosopis cineraria]|uniref:probable serine/threonine-protein kinase PIX13 n=1 Tax=Prosopis cineraria TaxID=364024 RepID=UPI00240FFEB1|nr:probable serine/threonine-protein kinase PIX13 [Prosopis cineraria]